MEDKEIDFEEILNSLLRTAEEDGDVTNLEVEFFNGIQKKAIEFQKRVEEIKEDDVISEDEFHEIIILRDQILNEVANFSTNSKDVNKLVKLFFEMVNQYSLPGQLDDELFE